MNSKFYRPHFSPPPLISSTPYASFSVSPNPSIFPPPPVAYSSFKKICFSNRFFFFFLTLSAPTPRFNHLIHLGSLVRDRWLAATKKKKKKKKIISGNAPKRRIQITPFPTFPSSREGAAARAAAVSGPGLATSCTRAPTHLAAGNKTFKRPTCEPT